MATSEHDLEAMAEPVPSSAGNTLHTLQIASSRDGSHVVIPPLELRVTSGVDSGTVYRATNQRMVIGVHPSADLALRDGTVSRFHCEVGIEGDRVVIKDLGS